MTCEKPDPKDTTSAGYCKSEKPAKQSEETGECTHQEGMGPFPTIVKICKKQTDIKSCSGEFINKFCTWNSDRKPSTDK